MDEEESVIVEKGEEGERKMSVVDGFVLEENKISYPNQRPSFVPEDFGKIKHSKSGICLAVMFSLM
jgi:hypothetical protein